MCGGIGYVGHRSAVPLMMKGLSLLEYGGYDSSVVALDKVFLAAFFALPILQLFSYDMAEYLDSHVEQARNQAKSVTVK